MATPQSGARSIENRSHYYASRLSRELHYAGNFFKVHLPRPAKAFSSKSDVPKYPNWRTLRAVPAAANPTSFDTRPTEEDSSLQYLQETDTFSQYSGYIQEELSGGGADWDTYDEEAMAAYFWKKPLLVARRLFQVSSVLGLWVGKRVVDARLGRSEEFFSRRAEELREALVQLGPTFVKIAQAVSSRPDVVPPAYLEQLSLLQDRIAPFSTAAALDILEYELGVPVNTVFSEMSPLPVAAASLGQVYQARLQPTGQAVAVKVQRPGVRAAIALDIFILRILAGWLRTLGKLNTDLEAVVDEWAGSLFKEMDYEAEARNGVRFGRLFGGTPGVVIPRVYPELSTRRVLIMEWIEGERLSQVRDTGLVEVGVSFSLAQLLDCGFYHADPHPGNLLRTPDGRLAYLDFGMMGEMQQDVREALIRSAVHLVNREFEPLADDFVALGLLPAGQENSQVALALTSVFRDAISMGVRNMRFGNLGAELGRTMYRFRFRIPPYFSLVVRSLTVLEGIALKTDPNYKILESAYPWIARKVLTDTSPQLRSTLKDLLYKDGKLRMDRLESLLQESTKPIAVLERSAIAYQAPPPPQQEQPRREGGARKERVRQRVLEFALSDEGAFIRDVLVEEVAKGMDAWGRMAVDSAVDSVEERLPPTLLAVMPPLPLLADEDEDAEHADNLQRLLRIVLLQGQGGAMGGDGGAVDSIPAAGDQNWLWDNPEGLVRGASAIASGIPSSLATFAELSPSARQQALLLPADLAGRIVSRAVARTIRQGVSLSSTLTTVLQGFADGTGNDGSNARQ